MLRKADDESRSGVLRARRRTPLSAAGAPQPPDESPGVTTNESPATDTPSRATWRIRRCPLSGPAFARPSTSGADISTLPKSVLV